MREGALILQQTSIWLKNRKFLIFKVSLCLERNLIGLPQQLLNDFARPLFLMRDHRKYLGAGLLLMLIVFIIKTDQSGIPHLLPRLQALELLRGHLQLVEQIALALLQLIYFTLEQLLLLVCICIIF